MKFTSRQVTTMIVGGAVAMVLVPTAAVATSNLFTIKDPVTSQKARVIDGALKTTPWVAPLESSPWASFNRAGNNASDRIILAGPTSKTITLSSLTASATGGAVGVRVRAVEPTDGSCASGHSVIVMGEDMSFLVPADSTQSMSFPSPIVAKPRPGHQICLEVAADTTYVPASGAQLTVSGNGFIR